MVIALYWVRKSYAEMRLTCESMVVKRDCTQVLLEIS